MRKVKITSCFMTGHFSLINFKFKKLNAFMDIKLYNFCRGDVHIDATAIKTSQTLREKVFNPFFCPMSRRFGRHQKEGRGSQFESWGSLTCRAGWFAGKGRKKLINFNPWPQNYVLRSGRSVDTGVRP